MANLDNMVDKRGGFRRDKRFGWQTAKAIFDNLFLLRDAIRTMFDATGYPNTREIPRIVGTYNLDANGDLVLDAAGDRTDRLPAKLTKLGVGSFVLDFKTQMPSANYSVLLTAGWASGRIPLAASYGNKTRASVELAFAGGPNIESTMRDPSSLTISIGWDG